MYTSSLETRDLKFRFMLNRHYLGFINHPLFHFAVIKVILVAIHLMDLNISILTSHLKLSRYQYTIQTGHSNLHLIKKYLEAQTGF